MDGLAKRPALASNPEAKIASIVQSRTIDVVAVFERFQYWGWIKTTPHGIRSLDVDGATILALSNRLRGMLDARLMTKRSAPKVVPIATLPGTSEALRQALNGGADACFETRDGFSHVVARAEARIVFLVPFIDATGADALASMLGECDANKKIVVARPDSRGVRHYLKYATQLQAAGAEMREYWLPRPGSGGPAVETFHAKLVMADKNVVYVGSSNLMASSLDGGLECGVLLEGAHARPFCRIVDAVLAISSRVPTQT